jgi:hypothetical protein
MWRGIHGGNPRAARIGWSQRNQPYQAQIESLPMVLGIFLCTS